MPVGIKTKRTYIFFQKFYYQHNTQMAMCQEKSRKREKIGGCAAVRMAVAVHARRPCLRLRDAACMMG